MTIRLRATPLATFEREGLKSALNGCGLPASDVDKPDALLWRFETPQDVPVGFGGLEIYGHDALLRSVVILPMLHHGGFGRAVVMALEQEAQTHRCHTVYAVTPNPSFLARLGYEPCERGAVPEAVRESSQFALQPPTSFEVMVRRFG